MTMDIVTLQLHWQGLNVAAVELTVGYSHFGLFL